MTNNSRHYSAHVSRRKPYDVMAAFDSLPPLVREALNYAAVNFSVASVANMCKRYNAKTVAQFIQQEDMRLIDLATKQKDALQDLKDLGL